MRVVVILFSSLLFDIKIKARLSTIKDRGCVWLRMGQIAWMLRLKKGEVKLFLKANSASQEYTSFSPVKIIVEVVYLQNFMIENVLFPKYMQLKFFSKEEFSSKIEIQCWSKHVYGSYGLSYGNISDKSI